MTYETPELTVLAPAINAVQGTPKDQAVTFLDGSNENEAIGAYADWE